MKLRLATGPIRGIFSPYAWHHPLALRWFTFIIILPFLAIALVEVKLLTGFRKERQLVNPASNTQPSPPADPLPNSKPRTKGLDLSNYSYSRPRLTYNRSAGNSHENTSVYPIYEVFMRPVKNEIQSKIETDLQYFGATSKGPFDKNPLAIEGSVDTFYPKIFGNAIWTRGVAHVKMSMTAKINDSTIVDKDYECTYFTSGLDRDYDGGIVSRFDYAKTMLSVAVRKTLDQFYVDLSCALRGKPDHFENILFAAGSAQLPDESANLHAVVDFMKSNPKTKIELDGYADNLGDLHKDKKLSRERAKVVKSYLVHAGIRPTRIKTRAFGATHSISNQPDEEAHKLNRRVEIVIIEG